MKHKKRTLVTSALPYANGALHLGHLAGAYLPADIYVRYLRAIGQDVAFICGSDEHGAAITIRAKKEGVSPQEIIDKYHNLNKATFQQLGISFDYYHRTSDPLHHETAQDFFLKLYEKGDQFTEEVTEQYYDETYDQFLADRYIVGECPNCQNPDAYGDQCEKCGTALSPLELKNPRSAMSGKTPILRKTKHWFFQLDKHEAWLREWIDKGTIDGKPHHEADEWRKHVVGQCMSWLDGGLQPRSITRDLDWGIPVPLEEGKGKVLYVWFDAPIGYISSTRQWAKENGKDWKSYWQGDDTELIHFIGKDNIVFHCIVFPAMLKAHGDYVLPINVPANQFLNFEGEKFSKSKGWGIEQHEYLEAFADFPNKEDALRFALVRNLPENKDSDFRWDDFVDFHDKELADNLGNFINRVTVLTHKYFDGKAPQLTDTALLSQIHERIQGIRSSIEAFSFKQAAQQVMELSSWGNTYLQDVSPWTLAKTDPNDPQIAVCMSVCLQTVAALSIVLEPFVPFTATKVRNILNLPALMGGEWNVVASALSQQQLLIDEGHTIGTPEILFAKINDRKDDSRLKMVDAQKDKLAAILAEAKAQERSPMKDAIQFDDFGKMDIRTGTILTAERVPKADKLLQLTVDLGFETRTIVSGIAQHFEPEKIIGQKVVVLANLAPRTLRGVESQGMILMAEDAEGKLGFVSPPSDWGNGFGVS